VKIRIALKIANSTLKTVVATVTTVTYKVAPMHQTMRSIENKTEKD